MRFLRLAKVSKRTFIVANLSPTLIYKADGTSISGVVIVLLNLLLFLYLTVGSTLKLINAYLNFEFCILECHLRYLKTYFIYLFNNINLFISG